jgi:hypothetical protein
MAYFDPNLDTEPRHYYPAGEKGDIQYHFWFDLEHGYFATAGSRIHPSCEQSLVKLGIRAFVNSLTVSMIRIQLFWIILLLVLNGLTSTTPF